MNLLLIGPLPPPLGGTRVSFKQLVCELSTRPDVEIVTIDSGRNKPGWTRDIPWGLSVLLRLLKVVRKTDVVTFHGSCGGAALFGPVVWLVCRIFGKNWVFRGFGGYFAEWYKSAASPIKWVFRNTVLQADVALFETRSSAEYFQGISARPVQWYANSRKMPSRTPKRSFPKGARRFVYVGLVQERKGIDHIIEAGELIDEDVIIDVYGPLLDGIAEERFSGKNVRYRGELEPNTVIETLKQYDVLLLPTYYETEGHPGAILEAYSMGLPVIATRWESISEIVNDDTGILIEPRNTNEIIAAMRTLIHSPARMQELSRGALAMAEQFSSEIWVEKFVSIARDAVDGSHHRHRNFSSWLRGD